MKACTERDSEAMKRQYSDALSFSVKSAIPLEYLEWSIWSIYMVNWNLIAVQLSDWLCLLDDTTTTFVCIDLV